MALDRKRWREISPYLDRAIEMGPEELADWLASLRAQSPTVAADLERLLADDEAIAREGFLEESAVPLIEPAATSTQPAAGEGAVSPEDAPPATGSIGPYRLVRRLGEGGMGIVYLAEQTSPIHREVALKVIRPGLDFSKVLARFATERQILADLSHPGISKIYDAGATPDGRPYVAMEFVPGSSLTRFCDEARSTVRERLELFLQVCAAIQYAHQKGVIHRDIKPSNLLVSLVDGRPLAKVIDFGIAKALTPHPGDEHLLTQTGMTLGTPEYMSPEQASGVAAAVDTRSDVYALGVVLYELLAGARPFEIVDLSLPTSLALLEAVRERDPPKPAARLLGLGVGSSRVAAERGSDPKRLARQLHGELEWITLRALEKDPSRRYASAAELAADIERHLKGEAVLAGPPSTVYRLSKLLRRHRVVAAALGAIAFTITAGAVVSTLFLLRAVRAERASSEQLHDSLFNQAVILTNSIELDRRGRALETLKRAAAIRPGLEARETAIAALASPGFRVVRQWLPPSEDSMTALSLSMKWPDSRLRRYAVGLPDGTVSVRAMEEDKEQMRLSCTVPAVYASFSPDGALLAVHGRDGDLGLWDLTARAERFHVGPASSYSFAPDGTKVVAHTGDRIRIFDLTTGRTTIVDQKGPFHGYWPAIHPTEGVFFVPVQGRDEIEFRRLTDGTLLRRRRVPPMGLVARWSADGKSLITAHADFAVRVWDWPAMGDAPRFVLKYHAAEPTWLSTDPGGRLLATSGWDNKIAIFDLRDGRLLLRESGNRVMAATDRPAFLLVDSARWTLVELEPATVLETIPIHALGKSPRDVDFSPDGRWLATCGGDGVRLVDRRTLAVHNVLEGEGVLRVGFTADSGELHAIGTVLRIWRIPPVEEGRFVAPIPVALPPGMDRPARWRGTAGISRNGERWLLLDPAAGTHGTTLTHGAFGAADVETIDGLPPYSNAPEISDDGRWLACGSWGGTNAVVVPRGSKSQAPVVIPTDGSTSVLFSPDSRTLVVGGPRDIRFFEVGSWRLKHALERPEPDPLPPEFAFTEDSRLCAVGSRDRVRLLDVDTGKLVATLRGEASAVWRLSFSRDDRYLAVASADHQVLLWDIVALHRELSRVGLDWTSPSD